MTRHHEPGAPAEAEAWPPPPPGWADHPQWRALQPLWGTPTHLSSKGYPYLSQRGWEQLRDEVPHLFCAGQQLLALVEALDETLTGSAHPQALHDARLAQLIAQIVYTATITSPPDLWLMRHVLGTMAELGLSKHLLAGEALTPGRCQVWRQGRRWTLDAEQLETDLLFLLSRGVVEQYDEGFRVAGHPRVQALLSELEPLPGWLPSSATQAWRRLFEGATLEPEQLEALLWLGYSCPEPWAGPSHHHWVASRAEVEIGYRLVPLVLGLRAAQRTEGLKRGRALTPEQLSARYPGCAAGALRVLRAAGWVSPSPGGDEVTAMGQRGVERGPGPFGIIETYHPYMSSGVELLLQGGAQVWVSRGENVGASQDANRKTFMQANDSLDRLCAQTGLRYDVFIEHAIGRGEAIRQRYERSGDGLLYVGADLEDAAIDAAIQEQQAGRLPAQLRFVRQADIADPDKLIAALEALGARAQGAVMMVGNGFHEIRDQSDERMTQVFARYHEAGIILLFTEENALSIDDLRATAWNTYHAGFKYVHEKSGQCLRPADPRPPVRLGRPLRAAWSECAQRAGYVRADAYCTRTRTVYPYTPRSGFNPSISVNHVFLPGPLAAKLGI